MDIPNIFSGHFSNIVKNVITPPDETSFEPNVKTFKDSVQASMKEYENHNSIKLSKNMMPNLNN